VTSCSDTQRSFGVRGSLGGDRETGVDRGFVRPEALTNFGVSVRQRIQS
jgi:hypothetical protein